MSESLFQRMMTAGSHGLVSHATNIFFQRFLIIISLPGIFLQNVGLFPEHRPGSLSWMMMPLLLSGVTGLAIQLESSNWSDNLNHAKSGLSSEEISHSCTHSNTGKTPTLSND